MRNALTILIIITLILPNLLKVGILIDFKIHQDYIAEQLCVEREIATSTCKGNCQLTKQLKEVDIPENKAPIPKIVQLEVILFLNDHGYDLIIPSSYVAQNSLTKGEQDLHTTEITNSIFHPPEFNLI